MYIAKGIKELKSSLAAGYEEWLKDFRWEWFCSLTYRGYPPSTKAMRTLKQWLAELKTENGSSRLGYFFVLECGASGENFHWHGLMAGLRDATERLPWLQRWQELAGEAQIAYFDPDGNGIGYMLKHVRPGFDDGIIFELSNK